MRQSGVQRVGLQRGLTFTVVIAAAYYGLLLLGAFAPVLLGRPVFGAVPLSFVLMVGFIVGAVGLTAAYAWRANAAEQPD